MNNKIISFMPADTYSVNVIICCDGAANTMEEKVFTSSHKLRNWEYEAFTDPTSMGVDEKDGVQDFELFK